MSSRYEKHTPVIQLDEITSSEEAALAELVALANSGTGEFIRKSAGSLVNSTLSETIALSGLSDVSLSSAAQGDILYHNGSDWVNLAAGTTGLILQTQGSGANPVWVNVTGGTVLSVSVVTANGVSGTVATSTLTPAITLTLGDITPSAVQISGLTASEIVITDASKKLVSAAVATYPSLTELIYVKGVTSAIQTQLGLKAPLASPTFTGTVTLPVGLTGVIRTDTGVVSVDSDVTDIVTAASLTAAGKVELATTAEINTGTDTARAIPIDQYVASNRNVRYFLYRVVEATTNTAVATTKGGDLELPFTGTITEIGAYVDTAGTTGTMTIDVNLNGTTLMTTNKITIDTTEKSSRTAATAPALTTTAVTAGDLITVDIDAIHTTPSKGLTIRLGVRLT